ncbi:MAG: hypothetical protein ACLFWI_06395 [Coleofasciculus sp.]|uniref:hypothetical protein n=1 Tax=Coleofasciculus sp. TaxID=3100458 RepID=UPI003A3E9DE2
MQWVSHFYHLVFFQSLLPFIRCHAFKLGIGSEQDAQCREQDAQCSEQDAQCSEQDAKPAAWLRLTHYNKDFVIIDIKV